MGDSVSYSGHIEYYSQSFEVYTHDIRIGELQAVATQTVLYDRDDG